MTSHIHHKLQTPNNQFSEIELNCVILRLCQNWVIISLESSPCSWAFYSRYRKLCHRWLSGWIKGNWIKGNSAVEWPLPFQLNSFSVPIHVIELIELSKYFPKYVLMHQMIVIWSRRIGDFPHWLSQSAYQTFNSNEWPR